MYLSSRHSSSSPLPPSAAGDGDCGGVVVVVFICILPSLTELMWTLV